MTSRYVAGFAFHENKIVLIRKNRPEHLAGQLIGPGGKVKEGETVKAAICREFWEEAGPETSEIQWTKFCELTTHRNPIHFFRTELSDLQFCQLKSRCEEGEIVIRSLSTEHWRHDCRPDILWLIPMALGMSAEEADGFKVQEVYGPNSKFVMENYPSLEQSVSFHPTQAVDPLAVLEKATATFKERAKSYGNNYKQFGGVMQKLFPQGVNLATEDQWNRFGVLVHIVTKLTRYTQRPHEGHNDSIHDIGLYSFILESLDLQGGQ